MQVCEQCTPRNYWWVAVPLLQGTTRAMSKRCRVVFQTLCFMLQKILEQGSPFVKNFLKPQVLELQPGKIKFKIPFRDEFVGNVGAACLHGGTISAAIDHCGGFCAWSTLTESTKTVSTVDMRVDFLLPS